MASITIRKLKESIKRKLKIRAADKGCSMEQEAREILKKRLDKEHEEWCGPGETDSGDLGTAGGCRAGTVAAGTDADPDWLKDWK